MFDSNLNQSLTYMYMYIIFSKINGQHLEYTKWHKRTWTSFAHYTDIYPTSTPISIPLYIILITNTSKPSHEKWKWKHEWSCMKFTRDRDEQVPHVLHNNINTHHKSICYMSGILFYLIWHMLYALVFYLIWYDNIHICDSPILYIYHMSPD